MPVYKPGTPEAQLSDLIDLAERLSRRDTWVDPIATAINEAAAPALAARIRAVSAEMVKAPAAQPESRPFKIGDRVRVARITCPDALTSLLAVGSVGTIAEHDASGDEPMCRQCWMVRVESNDLGWHSDEELEHVDA